MQKMKKVSNRNNRRAPRVIRTGAVKTKPRKRIDPAFKAHPTNDVRLMRVDGRIGPNESKVLRDRPDAQEKQSHFTASEVEYGQSLIDPFTNVRVKIPNIYPIETSTYNYESSTTLSSDTNGTLRVLFRPWDLGNTIASYSPTIASDENSLVGGTVTISFAEILYGKRDALSSRQVLDAQGYKVFSSAGMRVSMFKKYGGETSGPIDTLRLVSAGIKCVNVSPAIYRSGALTSGHTIQYVATDSIDQLRQLSTSHTTNCDIEHSGIYIPHEPKCYDFYTSLCYAVYRARLDDTTAFDFVGYFSPALMESYFEWPEYNTNICDFPIGNEVVPNELMNNNIYFALTGAPSQEFQFTWSINYEITPNADFYGILQPSASARGNQYAVLEELSTARKPGDSFWTKVKNAARSVANTAALVPGLKPYLKILEHLFPTFFEKNPNKKRK